MKTIRYLHLFFLLSAVCLLCGCDSDINVYLDQYPQQISQRIAANKEQIEKLAKAGIISSSTESSLLTTLDSSRETLGVKQDGTMNNQADGVIDVIKPHVVYAQGEIGGTFGATSTRTVEDGYDVFSISSKGSGGVSEDTKTAIDNMVKLRVKVLKKAEKESGDTYGYNSVVDAGTIIGSVSAADNDNTGGVDATLKATLESMFIENGRTILDESDEKNHFMTTTKDPTDCGGAYNAQKIWEKWGDKELSEKPPNAINTPGQDIVLYKLITTKKKDGSETYKIKNIIQVRLNEINFDLVTKVVGKDGVPKNTYLTVGNDCYLMEYPVFYVSGWQINDDGETFVPQYTLSDMQINLYTGEMHFRDGSKLSANEDRYHVRAPNGESSFVLDAVQRFGIKAEGNYEEAAIDADSTTLTEASAAGYKSWYGKYISNYGIIGYTDEMLKSSNKEVANAAKNHKKAYDDNLANFGSIVLRDYLEYTYMPGVVSGEDVVALGRIIRLTTFQDKVNNGNTGIIGSFVTRDGRTGSSAQEVLNSTTVVESGSAVVTETTADKTHLQTLHDYDIKITDVMAIRPTNDGKGTKLGFKSFVPDLWATGDSVPTEVQATGSAEDTEDKKLSLFDTKSGDLKYSYVKSLRHNYSDTDDYLFASFRFPGIYVGKSAISSLSATVTGNDDGSGKAKTNATMPPIFYGILLDCDPYNSALYSGWVNTASSDLYGSLDWWNGWLSTNKLEYVIDKNKVLDSISGAYSFDVTGNGYIILNLDTIGKIQDMYNTQSKTAAVNLWRTLLILLGILLICFSALLPICWIYDTNVTIGPRFLTIITLGKWVAVTKDRSTDEIRGMTNDKHTPMDLQSVLISAVIIMGIGIILTTLDPLAIIGWFVEKFSTIISMIEEKLLGI